MGNIRKVPLQGHQSVEHYMLLTEMRTAILKLQSSVLPPDDPTNLTVTPYATGNSVQFTRAANAQRYTLYISNTPSRDASGPTEAIAIDLSNSNTYNDQVGQAAFARYYWVRAWNGTQPSRLVGPAVGITLAVGATITPPKQVPAGKIVIVDQTLGQNVSGTSGTPIGGHTITP